MNGRRLWRYGHRGVRRLEVRTLRLMHGLRDWWGAREVDRALVALRALAHRLLPFLSWLPRVNRESLRADASAGLTGAVIVLPQGVAYAMIAGLPPEYGLYTAMVVPVVAGLFGSSWHMVSGPTAAISIVVLGMVSPLAIPGTATYVGYALTLTFLAGLFQFALGVTRMGSLVNFISHTVIIGFTAGAAVLIGVSQLPVLLGLGQGRGESVLVALGGTMQAVGATNLSSVLVAAVTLVVALLLRRYRPRWPGMLLSLIVGSVFCLLLDGAERGVALIGALPAALPSVSSPDLGFNTLRQLAPGALAVAILGLIEAVSIGRSLATRSHQRISGNQEFIGQGLSNMAGSMLSSYAGSGSFTRSGVNYDAGARTPLSALFAALFLAFIVVFLAPLTAYLPMPAMAAVILLVAWNLIDLHHIRLIRRSSKRETAILAVTLGGALLFSLEFAIYVGVILSLVLYLQRTSHPRMTVLAPDPNAPKRVLKEAIKHGLPECPQLKLVRLDGSLFFGAVDHVQGQFSRYLAAGEWKHLLVIGGSINFIDVAGAQMLVNETARMRANGGGLYVCGLKDSASEVLRRGKYEDLLGQGTIFASKEEAIRAIVDRVDPARCAVCARRVFQECSRFEFRSAGTG